MKHFIFFVISMVILFVWMYILENIFGLNLTRFGHEHQFLSVLLTISPSICFFGTYLVYFTDDNPEETPKEIEPKTEKLKTDNPENDEIITVTEIKGERNIIIDVVVKIIVFIIGLVLTGFLTSFLRYLGLSGVIITILGLLPLILAIKYCFKTNDKNKD